MHVRAVIESILFGQSQVDNENPRQIRTLVLSTTCADTKVARLDVSMYVSAITLSIHLSIHNASSQPSPRGESNLPDFMH